MNGRVWAVTTDRPPVPWWRHLNLGIHFDGLHPMVHVFIGPWAIRMGRHYVAGGAVCSNDPHEWKNCTTGS